MLFAKIYCEISVGESMSNIVVFGLDYQNVCSSAIKLAKLMHLKFVNGGEMFNKVLLKSADQPLLLINEELNSAESAICEKLSSQSNAIIAIPDDMFLSNENFKNFKNSTKILLKMPLKSKIKQNIENLLANHATITAKSVDEILEKLKK